MRRTEKPKLEIRSSASDYFYSLCSMSDWLTILNKQESHKKYKEFLKWIVDENILDFDSEKVMRENAVKTGFPKNKILQWLREIYRDLIDLNCESPELFFDQEKVLIEFTFHYFGNYSFCTLSLPAIPRQYEEFRFPFINATLGTEYFWVKNITYLHDCQRTTINILLEGGFCNKYRDFAIEKAKYEGSLSFHDMYSLTDNEIDDIILKRRRYN